MKMIIDIPDNELKDPLKNIHLFISNKIVTEVCIKTYDKDKPYFMNLNYALLEESEDYVRRSDAENACLNGWNKDYKEILADIRALPPVTPAEKQEPCTDAISRKDALFAVRVGILSTATVYGRSEEGMAARREIEDALRMLPPVKPIEKVGHWKKVTAENKDGSISWWYACSECGVPCPKTDHGTDYFGNYCSECGSRMIQEVKE